MPFRFASNSDRTAVTTASGIVWHYKSSCLDREEDLLLDFHKLHFFCLQAFDVDVVLSLRLFNLLPINDVDVSCPSSPRILHVADEESGVCLFSKDMEAVDVHLTSWFVLDLRAEGYDWSREAVRKSCFEGS